MSIQDISSILNSFDSLTHSLKVQWVEENIPFNGWVDISVKIERGKKIEGVNEQFLVATKKLTDIIFGFNAIKYLQQSKNDTKSIFSLFQTAELHSMKLADLRWRNLLN